MKWLTGFFIMPQYSFFELLSLLFIADMAIKVDNLWYLLLYVPVLILSTVLQRIYARHYNRF